MAMTNVQKSRARMLIGHPFWATLLLSVPAVEDRTCPTAYTTGKKIGYNPDFMESLTVPVCEFVWAHEVGHDMLLHGVRRGARNPKLWNIACDYAINLWLKDAGFTLWDKCCYDEKYRGMSADQIYAALQKELEEERKRRKEAGQGDPGQPGKSPGAGSGDPLDDMAEDGLGQDVRPGDMDADEQAETERKIKGRVAQAATMARMAGKLTADLERLVNEILDPAVPWEDVLRDYMTRQTHDNESWVRRNRRIQRHVLPGRWSEKLGEVIYIGDTSGSISDEENCAGATEVSYIADNLNPESVRLLWADTEVKNEQVFECGEPISPQPKGGGGTDMRVPLKYAEQYDPQVVILYTDGFTPWPDEEPPYPLIVCCTTDAPVPIGMVIRVKAHG